MNKIVRNDAGKSGVNMINFCGFLRERKDLIVLARLWQYRGGLLCIKHPSLSLEAVFMIEGSSGREKITVLWAGAHSSLNFFPMCH